MRPTGMRLRSSMLAAAVVALAACGGGSGSGSAGGSSNPPTLSPAPAGSATGPAASSAPPATRTPSVTDLSCPRPSGGPGEPRPATVPGRLAAGAAAARLCPGSAAQPGMPSYPPSAVLRRDLDRLVGAVNALPPGDSDRPCVKIAGPDVDLVLWYADGRRVVVPMNLSGCGPVKVGDGYHYGAREIEVLFRQLSS